MKFQIQRSLFARNLSIVSRAIGPFSPLPALSGIKIDVHPDHLILTGSDATISIQIRIDDVQVEKTGSIIIEAKYLSDLIRKLDSQTVQVEQVDMEVVRFSNEKGDYHLNGIEASQYPPIDLSKGQHELSLTSQQIKHIVNKTGYACGNNEQRTNLHGIHFLGKEKQLICDATDSYRLARCVVQLEQASNINVTIPIKSLKELVASLSDQDEPVVLSYNQKKVQCHFGQVLFQTNLIDASFPDMDRIIPNQSLAQLNVDTHEFVNALETTNFIRLDKVHQVRLDMNEESVHVKTNSAEIGHTDQVLTLASYQGQAYDLLLNGGYLIEAIKALGSSQCSLLLSGDQSPIRIVNPEDDSLLMVVVPIRKTF